MLKTKSAFITIDEELCKGCGLCVEACPQDTISLSRVTNAKGYFPAQHHTPEDCTACNKCAAMCPEIAIRVFIN